MFKDKKLSVIIPVYNVEKYLKKCIQSVIDQSYTSLELLLINDGSTDSSGDICNFYANIDTRIKVIHKENGGQSSARNIGLDQSTGYYIAFLDSDDWVDTEMYDTLIRLLEDEDADVAACGFKEVYDHHSVINSDSQSIILYNRKEVINSLFANDMNVRFELWNKIFTKQIIGDTRFIEKQIFEEVYFDRKVFFKLNKLVYVDRPMHNYLKVREGNTNSYFKENKLTIFKEFDDFISDLKYSGMDDSANRFEVYALDTSIALYYGAFQLNASKDILNKLRKQHSEYFYKINNNPYFNRKKSLLFKYFPSLYCWISKKKNKKY